MTPRQQLTKKLGAISVEEALIFLKAKHKENDYILVASMTGQKATTPQRLSERYDYGYPAIAAGPFLFSGGPPGRSKWYKGNLLNLVIDNILYEMAEMSLTHYFFDCPGFKVSVSNG